MFNQINVNPLGKSVGDCTTRSLAVLLYDGDWERAYIEQCVTGLIIADEPTSNVVVDRIMKTHGFKKALLSDSCPDCTTFGEFSEMYPSGRYLLCTGGHMAACINSAILDSWNSSDEVVSYFYFEN